MKEKSPGNMIIYYHVLAKLLTLPLLSSLKKEKKEIAVRKRISPNGLS